MIEADVTFLRDLLLKRSGLSLSADKRYLLESRLSMVCRQFAVPDLATLVRQVRAGHAGLTTAVVEAMTTNETLFFRDGAPFRNLRELLLPALIKAREAERTIRIWCAAASSGQEPYSIAMVLDEMAPQLLGWRVDVLATDISAEIIEKARQGYYTQFEVQRGLPVQLLLKHFTQDGKRWRISEQLRRMVTFKQHNLVNPQGSLGRFDIIFCRNVLIYFDLPTKARVFDTLARHLAADGFLTLGAAETVMGVTEAFISDRATRGGYQLAPPRPPRRPAPPPASMGASMAASLAVSLAAPTRGATPPLPARPGASARARASSLVVVGSGLRSN
jgi:chemotaxis protein methyltransferase CheR